MCTIKDDWDEERSVIGDKADIGFIDYADDKSMCSYNVRDEGPIFISVPFPLVGGKPKSGFIGKTITEAITIENTTDESVQLWSIQIYDSKPEKDSFTLSLMEPPSENSDEEYIREFLESFSLEDRVLGAGKTLTVWLSCKPKEIGLHTSAVHFNVGDDTIERLAFLLAEDKISHSLASNKPFQRRNRKKHFDGFSSEEFVSGSRPSKATSRQFKYRLPLYPIPDEVRKMLENKHVPDAVLKGLTKGNYASYFKTLVIMEEIKLEEDMRGYDMEHVFLRSKGSQFLALEVPGLAEKRPSLVYGDFILVKLASEDANDKAAYVYQGYIHRVEAEEVYLKFEREFHLFHRPSNLYNVQFTYNRTNMRRLYQAIEATEGLDAQLLFPSESFNKRLINPSPLVPISCMVNEQQMRSVEMILSCKGAPPYVIHGPPGTGKTMTLSEAILQIYTTRRNAQILVCAPSNSAADHILHKLLDETAVEIQAKEIFRLNAVSRPIDDINPNYIKFCYVENGELIFKCPPLWDLKRYRIVISTYASASLLYSEGIKRGHFSHIFLDEAGQASEPETMVPLSNLCRRDTVVVLAGDPMQLGPVIFSRDAEMYGLGKSYLERLFECKFYDTGDENYVTKLVQNYRCHPQILHLPSELFYNGELISCKEDSKSSLAWADFLPNEEFPVLFIELQGCDEREGSNPSWFNRFEVSKVVENIKILIQNKGFTEDDIGVITPYRQQVLKIKKALESIGRADLKVGSVEQFQGQEKEVIIISTVRSTVKHNEFDRNYCLGFLSNPRRFNVAITRARSLLIIIGNPHIISQDQYWNKLLWHCYDNGSYQGRCLPERQEVDDGDNNYEQGENYPNYLGETAVLPSDEVEWGQDSYYPNEIQKPIVDENQWSDGWKSDVPPSDKVEWSQGSFNQDEIPKPVLDEDEWSDGWK